MNVEQYLNLLKSFSGNAKGVTVNAPGGEYLTVDTEVVKKFFRESTLKTRALSVQSRYGEPFRGTVYSVKDKNNTHETTHGKGNYRTVFHGTSFEVMCSIIQHGFRSSVGHSLLLGDGGVYVGNFNKALGYVKASYMRDSDRSMSYRLFSRPKKVKKTPDAVLPQLKGCIIRCRADLGSVRHVTPKSGDDKLTYKSIKDKHDTLAAHRGSTVGGTVWGGTLRETEYVVDPKQLVIEELMILVDKRTSPFAFAR